MKRIKLNQRVKFNHILASKRLFFVGGWSLIMDDDKKRICCGCATFPLKVNVFVNCLSETAALPMSLQHFEASSSRKPDHLHILLITSGSVASIKAPLIVQELLTVCLGGTSDGPMNADNFLVPQRPSGSYCYEGLLVVL